MANVNLRQVRKVYPGGVDAVKEFNLDIADGEFVVLVGPSGCGKSTTLRMIAGLEDISSGEIEIGGRVVNAVHPKDRDIAMVFQNYALYPHMSVYKNMAFALKLRGVPRAEIDRRVMEAARILGLTDLLERKPKALSGGQRQRVAVGRAIVREPKAFLFDEPLSNLDAKLRVTTRAELKALHQRLKTTTVYVTHDQEEAMTLGDRIVVMSKGLVQQVGSPLDVFRRPVNRFVAGFIGTPPMNFLAGVLQRDASSLRFVETVTNAAGSSPASAAPSLPAASIPLPPERAQALAGQEGKPIVLGVRPHMLVDAASRSHAAPAPAPASAAPLDLLVKVVEPLGESMDVSCASAGHGHVVARVPSRAGVSPGQSMRFHVLTDEIHFFEPGEFGRNLLL
ncbi:MAG: sn-glycerol-3-phosphate ABC transporter ATP-binding protein UgpC [Planctomycetota bacterium]|nr:sn-glycerol-3-phosphate ABC transporter ATP-binding protein UgpC [Planctomycetota bacterium]